MKTLEMQPAQRWRVAPLHCPSASSALWKTLEKYLLFSPRPFKNVLQGGHVCGARERVKASKRPTKQSDSSIALDCILRQYSTSDLPDCHSNAHRPIAIFLIFNALYLPPPNPFLLDPPAFMLSNCQVVRAGIQQFASFQLKRHSRSEWSLASGIHLCQPLHSKHVCIDLVHHAGKQLLNACRQDAEMTVIPDSSCYHPFDSKPRLW